MENCMKKMGGGDPKTTTKQTNSFYLIRCCVLYVNKERVHQSFMHVIMHINHLY